MNRTECCGKLTSVNKLIVGFFLMLSLLLGSTTSFGTDKPVEAVLAKINDTTVLISDLVRFDDVYRILACAGLVKLYKFKDSDTTVKKLNMYIDQEIAYQYMNTNKISIDTNIKKIIQQIKSTKKCQSLWDEKVKLYERNWFDKDNYKELFGLLLFELEKRVKIEIFIEKRFAESFSSWVSAEKLKLIVKMYP